MEGGDDGRVVDIDKMTVTLEPDRITKGGLHVPGKDRMEFRPPERKSLLGLDVLAIAKRGSKGDGVFKVPQERNLSSLTSLDEDEMSASSGVDDIQTNTSQSRRSYSSRHYREASSNSKETLHSEVCSTTSENNLPRKGHDGDTHSTRFSNDHRHSEMRAKEAIGPDRGRYRSSHSRSPSRYNKEECSSERMEYRDEFRSEGRRVRQRHYYDSRGQSHDRDRHRQEQKHGGGYGRKQTRDESTSIHKSDKSDWDDGRWEWEDNPQRDNHSMDSRHYLPSPSPMLVGSSPDAWLVSPWLGGHTPRSAVGSASPWDYISPSPTPIRASGSSIRASSSRHGRNSHQLSFSAESSKSLGEDNVAGENTSAEEHNEFPEHMRLEMEYNADRAWYDREEGSTMFDADSSSLFLGADTSFPKEAELAKRLTRKDGTPMTLSQSKKLSQLTADNAQWEDRQLLRSGAVRGTEVQTEFDDEDERKVMLLVHDLIPHVLIRSTKDQGARTVIKLRYGWMIHARALIAKKLHIHH